MPRSDSGGAATEDARWPASADAVDTCACIDMAAVIVERIIEEFSLYDPLYKAWNKTEPEQRAELFEAWLVVVEEALSGVQRQRPAEPLEFPEPTPPLAESRLGALGRWLNVIVVEPASGVLWCGSRDFARAKDETGKAFQDRLIVFPVGTRVWYEPEDSDDDSLTDPDWENTWPTGVVAGYSVAPEEDMSWETVSPRCCRCCKPTAYEEQVTVEIVAANTHPFQPAAMVGKFGVVCRACER